RLDGGVRRPVDEGFVGGALLLRDHPQPDPLRRPWGRFAECQCGRVPRLEGVEGFTAHRDVPSDRCGAWQSIVASWRPNRDARTKTCDSSRMGDGATMSTPPPRAPFAGQVA